MMIFVTYKRLGYIVDFYKRHIPGAYNMGSILLSWHIWTTNYENKF